ncbi:MAG: FliH/SctL family protein [Bryobacterales bacterium]|nr:FliH/SctL family protein [Bryobacteraceae bacterium]MDW8129569.1 FliH/SctL family protein [Bryobacterales bacterium]
MASRVLRGEAAQAAEPARWPLVRPGAPHPCPETVSQEKLRELEVRLEEARREAAVGQQQAFEAGYRKGAEEGFQQASSQLKPLLEGLGQTLKEWQQARRRLRREAERDLVQLAIAIARRILHRELQVDPEALLGLVKAALERLEGREVDRIRVHPADAGLVSSYLEQAGLRQVRLIADPQLARGSLLLETEQGTLDASVETQLEEIRYGLLDRLQTRP